MTGPAPIERLVLAAEAGVWGVAGVSLTTYYLDLDAWAVWREPGPGVRAGRDDGQWHPIIDLATRHGGVHGEVVVGDRLHVAYSGFGGQPHWWLASTTMTIARPSELTLAALEPRLPPGPPPLDLR